MPHLHAALTRLAIENKRAGRHAPAPRLTPKELEILQLIYEGNSNKDISEALAISLMTVKNHTKNIYTKMQVKSRSEAIVKGIELQLVCLDRWLASACRQRPASAPAAAATARDK
ncbi:MAG: helix-turn-helix domain-containing protein [Gammaproteobacteria bacterium]